MDYIEKEYDEDVDAAYFRFSYNKVAETVELDEPGLEDYIIDLDEAGEVIGLEVLNYSDHAEALGEGPDVWNHLNDYPGFHLH